jgi:hypothetical protein
MAQNYIQLAVNFLSARYQYNGAATGAKSVINVAESRQIIFDMFEDVEANHRVHRA